MPVDASIPLATQQQPSLLQTLGSVYALKNAQQEGQVRDLQIQQAQRAAQDQKSLGDAYKANVQTGPNGQPTLDSKGFQQSILQTAPHLYPQVQQQLRQQQEDQLKLQSGQLAAAQAHTDYVSKHLQGIADADPAQKQGIYTQSRNQMLADGIFQPGSADDPGAIYPGDDAIKRFQASTMSAKDQIAAKQTELENQTKALTEAETARHNAELESQQRSQLARQQAADAETKRQHDIEARQRGQQIGLEGQRVALEGARLNFDRQRQGTQDQQSIEAQAQQAAVGDLKLPPQGRNNPLNAAIRARAFEINPQLSDELYTTKQDFFSSKGKANANVQSFNKVAEHVNDLRKASDDAGYTPFGITGSAKALSTAEQVFSTEDIKYLAGTGVAPETEIRSLVNNIHSSFASRRAAAIDQLEKMTASAGMQLGQQYERGTKMTFDPAQHFNPEAQAILKKRNGQAASGPPSGATHVVKGPDGKNHYTNAQGTVDLGVAP